MVENDGLADDIQDAVAKFLQGGFDSDADEEELEGLDGATQEPETSVDSKSAPSTSSRTASKPDRALYVPPVPSARTPASSSSAAGQRKSPPSAAEPPLLSVAQAAAKAPLPSMTVPAAPAPEVPKATLAESQPPGPVGFTQIAERAGSLQSSEAVSSAWSYPSSGRGNGGQLHPSIAKTNNISAIAKAAQVEAAFIAMQSAQAAPARNPPATPPSAPLAPVLPQQPVAPQPLAATQLAHNTGAVSADTGVSPLVDTHPWLPPRNGQMLQAAPVSPLGPGVNGERAWSECMRQLLQHGDIPHDVRLIADDGQLCAHCYFLVSRCQYFNNRLQGTVIQDPWQPIAEVRLEGMTVEVLKHVLNYIYTDTIDFSLEDGISLKPQEIEVCVHVCDMASWMGLPGLAQLLRQEVLLPISQTIKEYNVVQERQQREMEHLTRPRQDNRRLDGLVAQAAINLVPGMSGYNFVPSNPIADVQSLQRQVSPLLNHQPSVPSMPIQEEVSSSQMDSMELTQLLFNSQQVTQPGSSQVVLPRESSGRSSIEDAARPALAQVPSRHGARVSGATTLMIRNLPHTVKQKRFIKEIDDSGFVGTYDFAYLPTSFGGKGTESTGLGYAFVNFEEPETAVRFVNHWHGSRFFGMAKTETPLTVSAAEHQGKEVNVKQWKRKGSRLRNPDLRPFVKGGIPEEEEQGTYTGEGGATGPPALGAPGLITTSASSAPRPPGLAQPIVLSTGLSAPGQVPCDALAQLAAAAGLTLPAPVGVGAMGAQVNTANSNGSADLSSFSRNPYNQYITT